MIRQLGKIFNRGAGYRHNRGFALVTVIWGLGIITLLVVSYQSTARLRLQTAFNFAGVTRAELLADALANQTAMTLLSERATSLASVNRPPHDGKPIFCSLEGAAAAVAIEDEQGKVDLNAASEGLLQATFVGFGLEPREADGVARSIIAFRSAAGAGNQGEPALSTDKPSGLKHALYESIFELDQTPSVTPALFNLIKPFVTVHSRSAGVNAKAAPPALFAALIGLPRDDVLAYVARPFPNNLDRNLRSQNQYFSQTGDGGVTLVHVEVLLPGGQSGVREYLFDFSAITTAFALKERRLGQMRYLTELRGQGGGAGLAFAGC